MISEESAKMPELREKVEREAETVSRPAFSEILGFVHDDVNECSDDDVNSNNDDVNHSNDNVISDDEVSDENDDVNDCDDNVSDDVNCVIIIMMMSIMMMSPKQQLDSSLHLTPPVSGSTEERESRLWVHGARVMSSVNRSCQEHWISARCRHTERRLCGQTERGQRPERNGRQSSGSH